MPQGLTMVDIIDGDESEKTCLMRLALHSTYHSFLSTVMIEL